jgi:hypothetical protein
MAATVDSAIRASDLESHTAKIRAIADALHDLLMDEMYDHGPSEQTGWLHQVFTEALEREAKAIDDIVFGPDDAPDAAPPPAAPEPTARATSPRRARRRNANVVDLMGALRSSLRESGPEGA